MYENYEIWWVTGAQLLYGGDAVVAVDSHSKEMVDGLNNSGNLPIKVVYKGTANSSREVEDIMKAANNDSRCVGIITWMHTFSPAKMWIHGLKVLSKPLLHLHTQYNAEIPWDTMDMDFMNLNQSAHGDREFGHICARMRVRRKVVTGYWKDADTQKRIAVWQRVCAAWADSQDMLILRFGDQMNNVAVTDGDKVEAEVRMGYHVDYMPFSEVMPYFDAVKDEDVDALVAEYFRLYTHDEKLEDKSTVEYKKVWNSAKAELTLRAVLKAKGAKGFTTNFDDLGDSDVENTGRGFDQIPGLASQRLMAEGYGFGAEGDWKSAALYRTLWVMGQGMPGGCSFLEDYTLNFDGKQSSILQAHMLEVCPTIAGTKPKIQVHPLGIGDREDPARLVFKAQTGDAIVVTLVDMGDRLRMIVNDVECKEQKNDMPKLPVAGVLWKPLPCLQTSAEAWIYAGGAHHSVLSYTLTADHMRDFAEIMGIEFIHINKDTEVNSFKKELFYNDVAYKLGM